MLDETIRRRGGELPSQSDHDDTKQSSLGARPYIETLACNSSIQFFDLTIDEAIAAGLSDRYFECHDSQNDADGPSLHQVTLDETGVFHHPLTDAATDPSQTYAVDGRRALDAYAGCWVPLPFMRSGDGFTDPPVFEESPANWVRVFIHKDVSIPQRPHYKIVLAVDTALEAPPDGASVAQTGPSLDDALNGTVFRCSADVNDIGWFVTEPWVDEWLMEAYREGRQRAETTLLATDTSSPASLEHLAHYLTLLAVLNEARVLPQICLFASGDAADAAASTVPVDLVLDIGSSRAFALLAEAGRSQAGPAAGSPVIDELALRDLARPWISHTGIFESRVEFSRTAFGKDVYSRWSGRTNAFHWPSLARVGTEATRLASEQNTADAFTGLSSPMRYLWDNKASRHVWRFAAPAGGTRRNALISGPLLSHLSETGDLLATNEKRTPTTKPRFSRSSLLTFFAAELIQHAIGAINAPDYRRAHERAGDPRRLARIVVTVPSSLQDEERRIVAGRITAAVQLVWQAMGWDGDAAGTVSGAVAPPDVIMSGDSATNTQLAFLENEIRHKFHGKARSYFDLLGRHRVGQGGGQNAGMQQATGRTLRIATLDIGGGTTSLALTTYGLGDTQNLIATPHLIEGFATGSDDVLKALVEAFILPALAQRLTESKLSDSRQFLTDIVNGATHGRASRLGEFRRRLASEIALPAATAILKEHEILRATSENLPAIRTLGDLLSTSVINPQPAADELESLASDEGSDGFHCLGTPVTFTLAEVAAIIRRTLGPAISNAVRAIRALDCDVVLLSGWLSRLPVLKAALLEGMPIRPDRIIAMHEYRMGEWYPDRSALGNVVDPKSLAAVGALLGSRRPLRIGGLTLSLRDLPASAHHVSIGQIGPGGLIADATVLFDSSRSGSNGRAAQPSQSATIAIAPPEILGVRRSPLATWPALPMYVLIFDEVATDEPPKTPIRVQLEWKPGVDGASVRPWIVRATDADGIELASTEIGLRLQTQPSAAGHWLDTGVFAIA